MAHASSRMIRRLVIALLAAAVALSSTAAGAGIASAHGDAAFPHTLPAPGVMCNSFSLQSMIVEAPTVYGAYYQPNQFAAYQAQSWRWDSATQQWQLAQTGTWHYSTAGTSLPANFPNETLLVDQPGIYAVTINITWFDAVWNVLGSATEAPSLYQQGTAFTSYCSY